MDWIEPRTCIDDNLTVDDNGALCMRGIAVPRLVRDLKVNAPGPKTAKFPQRNQPGFLLINQQFGWTNDSPLEVQVCIRVFRAWKEWITSNPNVIQFRDLWYWAIDAQPEQPITVGQVNGQTGSGIDLGTNTVAEPDPGRQWVWMGGNISEEYVLVLPGQTLNVWYQMYVWTPDPWSNNANKNSPLHQAWGNYVRLQLIAHPTQGTLVTG